jgi:hypothetical protein
MSSGKQTSFKFGEISPLNKYKSNDAEYSNACERLYNMHVRRTGGLANRSGTLLKGIPFGDFAYQYFDGEDTIQKNIIFDGFDELLSLGAPMPIKTFNVETEKYGRVNISIIKIPEALNQYGIFLSNVNNTMQGRLFFNNPLDVERLEVAYSRGYFIFTPSTSLSIGPINPPLDNPDVVLAIAEENMKFLPSFPPVGAYQRSRSYSEEGAAPTVNVSVGGLISGSPPLLPAVYLITVLMKSGIEVPIKTWGTRTDSTGNIISGVGETAYMPVISGSTWIRNQLGIDFGALGVPENFAALRVYRAAASFSQGEVNPLNKNFLLVGQVAVNKGDGTASAPIRFNDFGVEDPSFTPPVDSSMLVDQQVSNAECAAVYQQRLFLGARPNENNRLLKAGTIIASQPGNGVMMNRNLVIRNTSAFPFEVPVEQSSRVVSLLSMVRLVAFTERGVYVMAGDGQQGIIAPTTVNPLEVSRVGCSNRIRAKKSSSNGVYIDNTESKLMGVIFNGQAFSTNEMSMLSEHLIDSTIVQMETIKTASGENQVFLLRQDGSIVVVTVHEDGTAGFSLYQLEDARVISMFVEQKSIIYNPYFSKIGNKYETISLYVHRKNAMYVESFDRRVDLEENQNVFLDSSIWFGSRLSDDGVNGHRQIQVGIAPPIIFLGSGIICYLNIEAADYSAGQPLTIKTVNAVGFDNRESDDVKIRFFFEDKEYTILIDWSTYSSGEVVGYCDYDIPEGLQDVQSKSISINEKKRIQSRWLPCMTDWGSYICQLDQLFQLYMAISKQSFYSYSTEQYSLEEGAYPIGAVLDDRIVSSPLNSEYATNIQMTYDGVSLSIAPFSTDVCFGYVGIPYRSEMQTLPIEPSDNRTLSDANKIINEVGLALYKTGRPYVGVAGENIENMAALITRNETDISINDMLFSGHIAPIIPSKWTKEGRIGVINVDPAPISIMAVYPKGLSGD